ncbi:M56 family metallopeptidase [Sphingobacterium sp. BIGb0165]|uniref:M56 family metallopeptidase n=1 Tax=Sphingobacterium sp. BIGb0165 TaxID=2940615 RepID=UPI002167BE4C|nr:M56 family metallopeptidase [Sphingobacterium sp. BIGb0165]MCS4229174.1 beta-lactamase regulating signal transducer with metallopeptidase domain [Sphingobacterium sp. BIGb0165]
MIIYLGKLIACSGLLYLVYIFLLQQHKLLVFNRFYLLAIIPIALFAPLLQTALPSFIPDFFHFNRVQPEVVPENMELVITAPAAVPQEPLISTNTAIFLAYLLIAIVLLIKYLLSYKKFSTYIDRAAATDNPSIYSIHGLKTPFSFFRRIYVPRGAYLQGEIEASIIAHEQAHVDQRHSIDVIVMQFMRVILWFNPMVYLIDRAVRQNHEYLADDAVVQVYERASYQHLIIQWSMSSPDINALPASNFNFLTTKKRLIMLQKRTNSGKLLLMPALTLLLTTAISLLFSTHVEAQKTTPAKTEKTEPAKPAMTPPASKKPGAPKAVSEQPNPPRRADAPAMEPKKNAAPKEETVRFPEPKKSPAAPKEKTVRFPEPKKTDGSSKKTTGSKPPVPKEVKLDPAPPKIEEVTLENVQIQEPKRVNVNGNGNSSGNGNANTNGNTNGNVKFQEPKHVTMRATANVSTVTSVKANNVQVNDPKTVSIVKTGTATSGSAKATEIRSAEPNTITNVNVRSTSTISSEAKENNGKRAAKIVLKGQPAKKELTSN